MPFSISTWRGLKADSSFWPSRLELVSVNGIETDKKGYVLDTSRMSEDEIKRLGLQTDDSLASDHVRLILDLAEQQQ